VISKRLRRYQRPRSSSETCYNLRPIADTKLTRVLIHRTQHLEGNRLKANSFSKAEYFKIFLSADISATLPWSSSASMVWHRRISPANFIVWLTQRVDSGCARPRQRISSSDESVVQSSVVAHSQSRLLRNTLPSSVTSSSSLAVSKSRLKTELFTRCYGAD